MPRPSRESSLASSGSRGTGCSWRTTPALTSASSNGSCRGTRSAAGRTAALHGRPRASPPGRSCRGVSLASLADFFGVPTRPCHRALPDAEATAQVLIHLIGLAQEIGARTLSELRALGAPRKRRVYGKRSLANGAPSRPGVYLFRDRHGQVLYVGRARDLRTRLRSYFRSERQRPSVEAALLALDRIEWRVFGSEFEAALEEVCLIRKLQPPANSRSRRTDQGVYLRRRGDELVVSKTPTELGPIGSRRRASLAARALADATPEELDAFPVGGPLPRLKQRLSDLAESLRYEEAARLRDRIDALEHVIERHQRLGGDGGPCLIAPVSRQVGARRSSSGAAPSAQNVRCRPEQARSSKSSRSCGGPGGARFGRPVDLSAGRGHAPDRKLRATAPAGDGRVPPRPAGDPSPPGTRSGR